jgi:hypothetical protein
MVNLYYPFAQNGYLGSNLKDKGLKKSPVSQGPNHRYMRKVITGT